MKSAAQEPERGTELEFFTSTASQSQRPNLMDSSKGTSLTFYLRKKNPNTRPPKHPQARKSHVFFVVDGCSWTCLTGDSATPHPFPPFSLTPTPRADGSHGLRTDKGSELTEPTPRSCTAAQNCAVQLGNKLVGNPDRELILLQGRISSMISREHLQPGFHSSSFGSTGLRLVARW